ncbi:MAG: discoidin domain-containing protein [Agathobacter sp.]|uniref:discoidin domain-containing protein n=1 Tax=Agathobacter sp. TaxID=2021311 RepID=UPI00258BC4B9|nr:discoidin domain-containing protein [Agathobacter sp.]MCR5677834.1 discoidin domain-containing protein [Agathobacter sp.]
MRKKTLRGLAGLLALVLGISTPGVGTLAAMSNEFTTAAEDDIINILMVGNSLTRYNNVAGKLEQLFAFTGKEAHVDTRTQMGASLFDQADILATSTRAAIVDGDYDYVVLQEKSSGFGESLLRQGVSAFMPWIEEAPSQPQLVLYMPWSNEDVFKSMQTSFTDAYVAVAKENDAWLAPSGEAYYDLYFNEGKKWYRNGDNVHGNDLASLVSASTLFYTISGQDQELLQFNLSDQATVKSLVESADYRNNRVDYDISTVNLIEEKAFAFTNTYRNLNDVPDLTDRGIEDGTNLARQKQGSASSNARGSSSGIGARNVGNLTDGSYTSFIVLHPEDPDPWFAVDLGSPKTINQTTLYWGATGDYADSYRTSFTVEGTNDVGSGYGENYETITTGISNGTDAQTVRFDPVNYRFVRIHINSIAGSYASMYEFEVSNAPKTVPEDPAVTVNPGDYVQVKIGNTLTNMSLYTNGLYEANVTFPAGTTDYEIISNDTTVRRGTVNASANAQTVLVRYFALTNQLMTGQDSHEDANGNPVQDIKKTANWTGNFFNRNGVEEFKEFGGWDETSPLSTLDYLGGGIFARKLHYTKTPASITYQYKINFDKTWSNGEVPADNRKVTFEGGDGTDDFYIWVDSVNQTLFDSLSDGTTTFRLANGEDYTRPVGLATVTMNLTKDTSTVSYPMVQTSINSYMATAFLEPGTYEWNDMIDDQAGSLSGSFTIDQDTAITFYLSVNESDYHIINTLENADGFFAATAEAKEPQLPPEPVDIAQAEISLSSQSFVYNGTAIQPAITVKVDDTTLQLNTDYTLTYSNNVNAGTASVTVTGIGNYTGSITRNFTIKQHANALSVTSKYNKTASAKAQTIALKAKATGGTISYKSDNRKVTVSKTGVVTIKPNFSGKAVITITAKDNNYQTATKKVTITVKPAKITLSSVKSKKSRQLTVAWKKNAYVTGYQIEYSTGKSFTKKTTGTVTITSAKQISKTIGKLTGKKTYYVRVRAYKTQGNTKYYSAWSNIKSVKVKK